MDWATAADVAMGLRLGIALENFWITHDPTEGLRRFEALLDRADGLDAELTVPAYRDYGSCADVAGDHERARRAYERSGALAREAGDDRGAAYALFSLGVVACLRGDPGEGRRLYEESLAIFRRLEDEIGELQALENLGWLEWEQGDRDAGLAMVEQAYGMAKAAGWVWWQSMSLGDFAELALDDGRFDEAKRHARDVVRFGVEIEDRKQVLFGLALLARAAAGMGESERAVRLWAAVQAQEPGVGRFWAIDRKKIAAQLPAPSGPVEVMPLAEAVEYALADRLT
jgi:tetratricopeptide (TPR) repeat protein